MEVFDGIWNLDWESSAILKRLILPAILCCFVLCNLLCALFHLFYKKHCDKGSDVCKFLLFLLAGTNQVTNCISTSVLFSVFSVLDDRYISCAIVNFEFFASILQLNILLLLSMIVFWVKFWPSHYASMYQRVLRRISTFAISIAFLYSLFTHWMACGARSFCPESQWRQTHRLVHPEADQAGRNPVPGVDCRIHVSMMYLPLGAAIAVVLTACTTAKMILECVTHYLRKVKALIFKPPPLEEADVSMAPLNSAACPTPTLPLPTSPHRLRLPTLMATIILSSALLFLSMQKLEDWRRTEIHWATLAVTNAMPLTWLFFERKLLSPLLSCSHHNNNAG